MIRRVEGAIVFSTWADAKKATNSSMFLS